ncbi:centromere kinetochore component CENP-T domain-containing protein [Purpureocillium lavendulum]|uniref:Centromere kinetochore component CENP-T domain-containing protein n=1 Tax=Purpureocillium lavendulum TaxID=1247861 RepID=A0AB34FZK1_9HYPO|nr:centromere kinetochore component CENP-T domain-containing protein [Purpureocillium lavendulum]
MALTPDSPSITTPTPTPRDGTGLRGRRPVTTAPVAVAPLRRPPGAPTAVSKFALLPAELRLKIWACAVEPRVVILDDLVHKARAYPMPAVTQLNVEARAESRRGYEAAGRGSHVDFSRDIFVCDPNISDQRGSSGDSDSDVDADADGYGPLEALAPRVRRLAFWDCFPDDGRVDGPFPYSAYLAACYPQESLGKVAFDKLWFPNLRDLWIVKVGEVDGSWKLGVDRSVPCEVRARRTARQFRYWVDDDVVEIALAPLDLDEPETKTVLRHGRCGKADCRELNRGRPTMVSKTVITFTVIPITNIFHIFIIIVNNGDSIDIDIGIDINGSTGWRRIRPWSTAAADGGAHKDTAENRMRWIIVERILTFSLRWEGPSDAEDGTSGSAAVAAAAAATTTTTGQQQQQRRRRRRRQRVPDEMATITNTNTSTMTPPAQEGGGRGGRGGGGGGITARDKLLIHVPQPAPAGFMDALAARFPQLEARWEVARLDPVRTDLASADTLPRDVLDGVTMLCVYPPADAAAIPDVRFVQLISAGSDRWVGHEKFSDPAVVFCSGSGCHAPQIAEWVMAAWLSSEHHFDVYKQQQLQGKWSARIADHPVTDSMGRRMAIFGYGAIGRQCAHLGRALGMDVVVYTQRERATPESRRLTGSYSVPGTGDPDGLVPSRWFHGADARAALADMLRLGVDLLVLAVPLSDSTRGLVGRREFALMRDGGDGAGGGAGGSKGRRRPPFLCNIARGPVVDSDALVDALRDGSVRGAALDVTDPEPLPADHPLWTAPNVFITPHVSWQSTGITERLTGLIMENLERLDEGRPLLNQIKK